VIAVWHMLNPGFILTIEFEALHCLLVHDIYHRVPVKIDITSLSLLSCLPLQIMVLPASSSPMPAFEQVPDSSNTGKRKRQPSNPEVSCSGHSGGEHSRAALRSEADVRETKRSKLSELSIEDEHEQQRAMDVGDSPARITPPSESEVKTLNDNLAVLY
jgi:hypothetical protein